MDEREPEDRDNYPVGWSPSGIPPTAKVRLPETVTKLRKRRPATEERLSR